MVVFYDDQANKLGETCVGSTRYGGCSCHGSQICYDFTNEMTGQKETMKHPTAEVVEKARFLLEEHILAKLTAEETRSVMNPNVEDLLDGLTMCLKEGHKNQIKVTESCRKCSSSGKWVNPRNPRDIRECFACHGTGEVKTSEKAKDANGKIVYERLPVGLFGVVIDWTSHGTFYRNGYNQPNAENTTVKLRGIDGKVWQAPLCKLRLSRTMLTADELRTKAHTLSYNLHFGSFASRFTWYDRNYAEDVA